MDKLVTSSTINVGESVTLEKEGLCMRFILFQKVAKDVNEAGCVERER